MAKVTVNYSEQELKKIITKAAELEYQRKVVKIEIKMVPTYDGHPFDSAEILKFGGVELELGEVLNSCYQGSGGQWDK